MTSPLTALNVPDSTLTSFPILFARNTNISSGSEESEDDVSTSTRNTSWPSEAVDSNAANNETESESGPPWHEIEIRCLRAQLEAANSVRTQNSHYCSFALTERLSTSAKYILSFKTR